MEELQAFGAKAQHSWLSDLVQDPEAEANAPNKSSRQVRSGHYVRVKPTPLPRTELVICSKSMADELGLSEEAWKSREFTRFFSGNMDAIPGLESWATPYALSIFGQEMYQNCPFKNGNGYGDGRAVSVGEVVVNGKRWEMQLKGGGQTPFCRGADGRAVLRSSVREFLASEAMHSMGVETTRALSLVVSAEETVDRPWYNQEQQRPKIDADLVRKVAPHLANATPDVMKMAIRELQSQVRNPDFMQTEKCAITCRVAPSFARVGHMELHGRRARKGGEQELQHLELMARHALFREYSDVDDPSAPLQARILTMVREFGKRLSRLMADWLRVGYCQGNFNSDNCLLSGRTMDYGPFGFIEKYDPLWNMWVGGGEHFAFMNQPGAARKNYFSFVKAVAPLLDEAGQQEAQSAVDSFEEVCDEACNDMWRRKMGLKDWDPEVAALFSELKELMADSELDYTIFWRQLAELPTAKLEPEQMLEPLKAAFYEELSVDFKDKWRIWLEKWNRLIQVDGEPEEAAKLMRKTSPKYVPREWMLVEAYNAANMGDYSLVHTLHGLFSKPFDEQPEFEGRYYRKTPASSEDLGGTAFMS